MKTLKTIGGVICIILALVAFGGLFNGRPSMIVGTFIFGAGAYFLLKK